MMYIPEISAALRTPVFKTNQFKTVYNRFKTGLKPTRRGGLNYCGFLHGF
jgi:hypothetical protein